MILILHHLSDSDAFYFLLFRLALCEELGLHVSGNQTMLEHQQFDLIVRLMNAGRTVNRNCKHYLMFVCISSSAG